MQKGMMRMTRDEKVSEALERMRLLKFHPNVITEFLRNQTINASEGGGFLFWLTEKEKDVVTDFENTHNALVYHVIRNTTELGALLSLMYVSDNKDEWVIDREDIKNGEPLVYVKNMDDDMMSEFGYISITPRYGGLVRVA